MLQALKRWVIYGLDFLHLRVDDSPLTKQAIVHLDYASYQGTVPPSGVSEYLGIRYAAPPVGDLRFRAPIDPLPAHGIQNATSYPSICLGINTPFPLPPSSPTQQSEDCLNLNIWAPTSATPSSNLPVWFFIQGGGYNYNANANYNGSTVVATSGLDVVFVNFNYRVGVWGFLAGERLERRGGGDLNVGLLDQRRALSWVRRYISAFGGNPNHVVIHGDSAGGGSVALQMAAYGGKNDNLFIGAIGESIFFTTIPKPCELEWQFDRYVHAVGCNGTYDELQCLRGSSTSALQAANVASPYPGQTKAPLFYWTPAVDGTFLVDHPYSLFERGAFVKVPLMIGDDTDEGTTFAPNATTSREVTTFLTANFPHLTHSDNTSILSHYAPLTSPLPHHASWYPIAAAAYGEAVFTCPGLLLSSLTAELLSHAKVWNYRYDVDVVSNIAAGVGVPHVEELPVILGLDSVGGSDASGDSNGKYGNGTRAGMMMQYYLNFVRGLDPNFGANESVSVRWESYSSASASWKKKKKKGGKQKEKIEAGKRLLVQTNGTQMESTPQAQVSRWNSGED